VTVSKHRRSYHCTSKRWRY